MSNDKRNKLLVTLNIANAELTFAVEDLDWWNGLLLVLLLVGRRHDLIS